MTTAAPAPLAVLPQAPPTVGVEEEFLLLGDDGRVACVAPDVLQTLDGDPYLKPEFMRFQVESNSVVCTDLRSLGADLLRQRRRLARAAALHGAHLVAAGTPPFDVPGVIAVTDRPRYRGLAEHFPDFAGDQAGCGSHVHVGVASEDVGLAVINRIRGWMPVLLALTVNSPGWRGRHTGWDSYRYVLQQDWPSATIPPVFDDTASYHAAVSDRIARGDALDARSVYFYVRLSPQYPTVEIRIADTGLTVADSLLYAALCRALATTAVADAAAGRPQLALPDQLLHASALAAARSGLRAQLVDPECGRPGSAHVLLRSLVRLVSAALDDAGDTAIVDHLLRQRLRRGSGAARQRALWWRLSREGFVERLERATVDDVVGSVGFEPTLACS